MLFIDCVFIRIMLFQGKLQSELSKFRLQFALKQHNSYLKNQLEIAFKQISATKINSLSQNRFEGFSNKHYFMEKVQMNQRIWFLAIQHDFQPNWVIFRRCIRDFDPITLWFVQEKLNFPGIFSSHRNLKFFQVFFFLWENHIRNFQKELTVIFLKLILTFKFLF